MEKVINMKILFVLDSMSDWCGANVNIAITIKKQLKQIGCEVFALAKYDSKRPPSTTVIKSFDKVYFLDSDTFELFHSVTNNNKKSRKNNSFIWLLKHPGTLFKTIDIIIFNAYFTKREFSKKIDEICMNHNIDAVIGVAFPYYLAEAVAMSKTDAIKTVYQLDPYTNNYKLSNTKKESRRRIESEVIEKLDILFAANFVKDDLLKEFGIKKSSKIVETNIPGIKVEEVKSKVYMKEEYSQTIDFLFAGKFYQDIRNPKYLLEIFSELPLNYILHIAGTGCENIISPYKERLGNRLIQYGQVSKQKVNELIQCSNILINVDNTIYNQMPSKIVDYICTGKKIINFCKSPNTLSNHLLENYSNGISIYEDDIDIKNNVEKIIRFIKVKSDNISENEILENYIEYTDKFVTKLIFDSLNQFRKNR